MTHISKVPNYTTLPHMPTVSRSSMEEAST